MNYELAKKLKDAGFHYSDQKYPLYIKEHNELPVIVPTLSELIEACGGNLALQQNYTVDWFASKNILDREEHMEEIVEIGRTPEEAVANLFLALNSDKISHGKKENDK